MMKFSAGLKVTLLALASSTTNSFLLASTLLILPRNTASAANAGAASRTIITIATVHFNKRFMLWLLVGIPPADCPTVRRPVAGVHGLLKRFASWHPIHAMTVPTNKED